MKIWSPNIVASPDGLERMCQSLDATLFHLDKTGWEKCWSVMTENYEVFEGIRMKTRTGYFGVSAQCKHCKMMCGISWESNSAEDICEKKAGHVVKLFWLRVHTAR